MGDGCSHEHDRLSEDLGTHLGGEDRVDPTLKYFEIRDKKTILCKFSLPSFAFIFRHRLEIIWFPSISLEFSAPLVMIKVGLNPLFVCVRHFDSLYWKWSRTLLSGCQDSSVSQRLSGPGWATVRGLSSVSPRPSGFGSLELSDLTPVSVCRQVTN